MACGRTTRCTHCNLLYLALGCCRAPQASPETAEVARIDLGDWCGGEGLFIPNSGEGVEEDDGFLVTFVSPKDCGKSGKRGGSNTVCFMGRLVCWDGEGVVVTDWCMLDSVSATSTKRGDMLPEQARPFVHEQNFFRPERQGRAYQASRRSSESFDLNLRLRVCRASPLFLVFLCLSQLCPFFFPGRAPRVGCQDHESGPRGHREATREGSSWFPRSLR